MSRQTLPLLLVTACLLLSTPVLAGRGTNWENPPGWRGGPGASPDRYGRCR